MPQRAPVPQRAQVLQRAQMQVPQRAWILQRVQAGASKSTGTSKSPGTAGLVGSSKSVGTAGRAGTPQVAVTAITWSVLAASPGSTGIKKKDCKSARTSRKGVSLLACRQYRRRTSAKGDALRIGVVSIRITHS